MLRACAEADDVGVRRQTAEQIHFSDGVSEGSFVVAHDPISVI
jgi:hypothetical protein